MSQMWWFVTWIAPWVLMVAVYAALGAFTAGHVEVWMKKHSAAGEKDRDLFSFWIGVLWPILIPVAVFYVARVGIDPQTRAEKRSEQIERDEVEALRTQQRAVAKQFLDTQEALLNTIQARANGANLDDLGEEKALETLEKMRRAGGLPDVKALTSPQRHVEHDPYR